MGEKQALARDMVGARLLHGLTYAELAVEFSVAESSAGRLAAVTLGHGGDAVLDAAAHAHSIFALRGDSPALAWLARRQLGGPLGSYRTARTAAERQRIRRATGRVRQLTDWLRSPSALEMLFITPPRQPLALPVAPQSPGSLSDALDRASLSLQDGRPLDGIGEMHGWLLRGAGTKEEQALAWFRLGAILRELGHIGAAHAAARAHFLTTSRSVRALALTDIAHVLKDHDYHDAAFRSLSGAVVVDRTDAPGDLVRANLLVTQSVLATSQAGTPPAELRRGLAAAAEAVSSGADPDGVWPVTVQRHQLEHDLQVELADARDPLVRRRRLPSVTLRNAELLLADDPDVMHSLAFALTRATVWTVLGETTRASENLEYVAAHEPRRPLMAGLIQNFNRLASVHGMPVINDPIGVFPLGALPVPRSDQAMRVGLLRRVS